LDEKVIRPYDRPLKEKAGFPVLPELVNQTPWQEIPAPVFRRR
jgi:hypothetical protein